MFSDFLSTGLVSTAVVPIFVNAGAALLPAILAALATALSLLFKPRELYRACRRRPLAPLGLIVVGVALWFGWGLLPVNAPERRREAPAVTGEIDWTQVALAIIRARETNADAASTSGAVALDAERPIVFRRGPDRLGYDGGPVPTGLKMRWEFYPQWTDEDGKAHEDREAMILSSPAVVGSAVYGASCLLDPPGNYGTIFRLDAATGRAVWSIDTIGDDELKGFFSSPAVTADGKFLIVGQGLHPDSNCNLICLKTETGELHWKVPVDLHLESSPAIAGDLVVIGVGAIENPTTHKPMGHAGFVLAVRISDGQELWRYDVADPESSPAIAGGVAFIGSGFNGKAVVALRTASAAELQAAGQERLLWRVDTEYPITGAVTIIDDLALVGGGTGDFVFRSPNPAGVVLALDRLTGERRWERRLPDAVLGAVAAGGEVLICPVANGEVVALRRADGEPLWRQKLSGEAAVLAAPALAGDSVFALSQDGYLARLSATDGKVLERHYVNSVERPGPLGLTLSSPVVAGGRLYVGSETGGLRCYGGSAP